MDIRIENETERAIPREHVRCAMRVDVPGQPPLLAQSVATTPRVAFDESHARIVRRLERAFARWDEVRRRPKKYFLAKRLLTM